MPRGFLEDEGSPVLLATHTYGPEARVLARGSRVSIVEGEPRLAAGVAEIRWISAGKVDGADFAREHDREFVRSALQSGDDER